jgi:two-component system, OmpR family, sensor kinase
MGSSSVSRRSGSSRVGKRPPRAAPSAPADATATRTPTKAVAAGSSRVVKKRDPLLSAICHDLRAPLAAVTMGANFVLQTTRDDEASARSRRILEAMLRSCTQMERLVRNFADLAEIEAESVDLRLGVHDAGEMLALAAQQAGEAAQARGVTIEVAPATGAVRVRADRERMLRAIGHLLDNAIRASREGGVVTLSATRQHGLVELAVKDRGTGLSPEVLKNLFDREWHAKRANRATAGFGLAITQGFVLAHDGRIDVESHPGVETTIVLALPADESLPGPS